MPEVQQPLESVCDCLRIVARNAEELSKRIIDALAGSELRNMDQVSPVPSGLCGELVEAEATLERVWRNLQCIETLVITPKGEDLSKSEPRIAGESLLRASGVQ